MAEKVNITIKPKHRVTKGHYGYIYDQKRRLVIRTAVLAAGIIGLVVIGYIVTKTTKNLMSLGGILTAIPMAMQLAQLIAYWKFQGRPEAEYEEIKDIVGEGVLDTDLVIAKRDGKSIPVNYACFTEEEIFCFTEDSSLRIRDYTEYLHTFLRLSKVDCEIRLFNDLNAFKGTIKKQSFPSRSDVSDTVLEREGVFRAISM